MNWGDTSFGFRIWREDKIERDVLSKLLTKSIHLLLTKTAQRCDVVRIPDAGVA
jgi:hypothetical protein